MNMQSQAAAVKQQRSSSGNEQGFTLIELMVVMVVGLIMTVALVSNLQPGRKSFYAPDSKTNVILDMFREANLQALNNRRGFRVQINFTRNQIILLDEGGGVVRVATTGLPWEVLMSETPPANISTGALPAFNSYVTETIGSERVINFRFRSDGTITKTDGTVASGRLFIWQPKFSANGLTPLPPTLVRAITVFGPSNSLQLWKYRDGTFING
jgi:prepilin-type N-terminal cleavage/methylation domain-containing protein